MKKRERPEYHRPSLEGIYSPTLAERAIDEADHNYTKQMNFWWDSLTKKEKLAEWKKDGEQLQFYVSKPK